MTNSIATPPQPTVSKTKAEKAHNYLSVVSTSIGICGALGTLFVWLVANFYVGDLEIKPDHSTETLTIKVYDQKGQETVYHSPRFQLMPGRYHMDVIPEGAKTVHTDVTVRFRHNTEVPVAVITGSEAAPADSEKSTKHHWWEFWR